MSLLLPPNVSEQNLANALDAFGSEHESSYVSGAES
jgi:hypothetical protein